ncbi:MAG: hypothetical protein IIB69_11135 [Proteobacteria bacterium]|nr:hypothetical protein [Pseudomonadota bacterium]
MITKNLLIWLILTGLVASPAFAGKENHKSKILPYGLQKNLERGKPLPPGWQMKLARGSILDANVYRHGDIVVPVDKHGLLTLRVEGKLIRLYQATREIAEILN